MRTTSPTEAATLVERTMLPRILVRGKGQVRYHAYVHSYVIGPKTYVKGVEVSPLYYLSLVAMRGEGTIVQGIWSSLIANVPQDVYIEGVGTVVLAHHQHTNLRYTLHWNYHLTELPSQDLHVVIESHMLSMCDPVRGTAPIERERQNKKKAHGKQKRKARGGNVALTTLAKKDLGDMEEELNRQKHPLFLLMVPGSEQPERGKDELDEIYEERAAAHIQTFLAKHHFAFLDLRVPWAMAPSWAPYLWERGIARREILPLTVWSASIRQSKQTLEEEEKKDVRSLPLFLSAWLCRPNTALLPRDLKQARLDGRIGLPDGVSTDTVSPALPEPLVVASR